MAGCAAEGRSRQACVSQPPAEHCVSLQRADSATLRVRKVSAGDSHGKMRNSPGATLHVCAPCVCKPCWRPPGGILSGQARSIWRAVVAPHEARA